MSELAWKQERESQARLLFGRRSGFRFSSFLSFLAVGADAEYSMAMMKRLESVVAGYFILQLLNLFIVKLDQSAAAGTDKMVVVSVFVVVLVKHPPVVELELPREAAILEQLQCAIHCSESNGRVFGLNDCVEILAGNVSFCIQKHIEYQIALTCSLQPCALEVFLEDLFLFAFHKLRMESSRLYTSGSESQDTGQRWFRFRSGF
jgi:hypothetical protein